MSARRILLIDSDPDFQARLQDNFAPYGFEIVTAHEDPDSLGGVPDMQPEVIFIAVELPDKTGYSLCNKAKKGVARQIPVVLTTASVPPSGFLSHRKLKVHADEYLDKRTLTDQELVDKMNALVGLGDTAVGYSDDLDLPVEVEELEIDDLEFEEPQELSLADIQLEAEGTDAGLSYDSDFDDGATRVAAPSMLTDVDSSVEQETEAAFAAIGFGEGGGLGGDAFEGDEPPTSVHGHDDVDDAAEPAPYEFDAGPGSSARFDASPGAAEFYGEADSELGLDDGGAPPILPEPMYADDGADDVAVEEVEVEASERIDLGLDAVAELAQEEQSGIHERRDVARLRDLERENERLKQRLQEHATASSDGFSREREFLNLREVINKKEKLILDLQDELGGKDRQILDSKARIRQLEHAKADLDEKALQLEQAMLEAQERAATLDAELGAARQRTEELEQQTQSLQAELAAASAHADQRAGELTRATQEHQQAIEAIEATHREQVEQLRSEHAGALAAQAEAHEQALADAQAQVGAAMAAAREQSDASLAEAKFEHEQAIAALVAQKDEERDKAVADATAAAQAETQQALAAAAAQHANDRQALEDQYAGKFHRLEQERDQSVADAEARRTRELAEAAQKRQDELAQLAAEHEATVARLEQQHADALAAADQQRSAEIAARDGLAAEKQELEGALSSARERIGALEGQLREAGDTITAREADLDSRDVALTERDGKIRDLDAQLRELEGENTSYQEQVLEAYQKLKQSENVVGRAKKAMAIALTLLDGDADNQRQVENDS